MADRDEQRGTLSPPFRVGDWHVEPSRSTVTCGDLVRHLEPKMMDALVVLARRAGDPVSKSELTDAVWQVPFISENRLVGIIAELRRAFGDDAHAPRYVETIPTRGYRLAMPVEWATPGAPSAPRPESRFVLETPDHIYRLGVGANTIGRDVEADVCVASEWVSRRHARLEIDGDRAVLEDLGSKNGTFVNGTRVIEPMPLRDGDEIRLGRAVVVLRFSSGMTITPTATSGLAWDG